MILQEVLDSGVEFQAIYNNKNKLKPILESKNIRFTELKPTYDFIYLMTEKPVQKRDFSVQNGYKSPEIPLYVISQWLPPRYGQSLASSSVQGFLRIHARFQY